MNSVPGMRDLSDVGGAHGGYPQSRFRAIRFISFPRKKKKGAKRISFSMGGCVAKLWAAPPAGLMARAGRGPANARRPCRRSLICFGQDRSTFLMAATSAAGTSIILQRLQAG